MTCIDDEHINRTVSELVAKTIENEQFQAIQTWKVYVNQSSLYNY